MRIELLWNLPKDRFLATLQQVKSIQGRLFSPNTKTWSIPYSIPNINLVKSFGFSLDETLAIAIDDKKWDIPEEPQARIDRSKLSVLPYELRKYQLEAIRFAEANNWRCLISLAPRMGKTVVSLCNNVLHDVKRTLIVCPASIKIIWRREIKKVLNKSATILVGETPYPIEGEFVIINYDILWVWKDYLHDFDYMILDESSRISNPTIYQKNPEDEKGSQVPVKCTNAALELTKKIKQVVLLSGTPATGKTAQLQTQLSIFSSRFTNRYYFLNRYCDPQEGYFGMTYDGATNIPELQYYMAPYVFRRTKEQGFDQLPKEIHETVPIEIDGVLYRKEIAELEKEMSHLTQDQIDERLSKFESLSYTQKRGQLLQWVKDFLELHDKLIIYCWHKVVANDLLAKLGKKAVMVNGEVSAKNKQANIDRFNTDPKCKVFIGQISAVKEGISLYASDSALYAEFGGANAGAIQQCNERMWLPELDQKQFNFYYAVGEGTLEEKRMETLKERGDLLMKVLDIKRKV